MLKARLNQSGFCVSSLHQRHINTGSEKPHSHAEAGSERQPRAQKRDSPSFKSVDHGGLLIALHLIARNIPWQHRTMITFRPLSDDHPDLAHSPLLRAALLTLQYAQEHGAIGLTQTKAFKRVFVHWAVVHFDWPGSGTEEIFYYNKVINDYEFAPLEVLHYLLITPRLGRHFKGIFDWPSRRVTEDITALAEEFGRYALPCR
jgi:hypothetical protein